MVIFTMITPSGYHPFLLTIMSISKGISDE